MLRRRLSWTLAAAVAAGLTISPAFAGKKDDTLVWSTDRENPIADPYFINTRELVVVGHYVWDTLVFNDPAKTEIKPLLATSWKWANDTTLEMELRTDVKFHSGKTMDADDVVYTLDFVSNKDHAIMNYALMAWIKSAEKIDANKVRINLHKPFPPALAYLGGLGFIMQKGHWDDAPTKADGKKDYGAVKPNGTGPYKITEIKPGEFIHAVKNPDYFKGGYKGTPSIGNIRFRTIKDAQVRAAELMTGAIDWMWDVPKDQAERLAAIPAVKVENAKTLRISYLAFDVHGVSGNKMFTDKRARQAIAHAINRESITKNLVGPASTVIHAACHPDQFGCTADVEKYAYDPEKAKKLLAEAGVAPGAEFDLWAYREREYTEAVIGDLVKVGLKPKLNYVQFTAFQQNVRGGKANMNQGTWGSNSIPDTSASTSQFFTGGPDDQSRDDQVMKGIAEADGQTDPEKRKALWAVVHKRIAAEAYWVPMFTYAKYYAFSKDLDFTPTSDEIPPFFAAKWK
jgi:peptide/nickel transport system substrate-binding protein